MAGQPSKETKKLFKWINGKYFAGQPSMEKKEAIFVNTSNIKNKRGLHTSPFKNVLIENNLHENILSHFNDYRK